MTDFTTVGKSKPLIDGRAKVLGALRYAPDLKLPGMLYARFVPSMYAHANIRSIDASEARAVHGVVAVLTADDLPNISPTSRQRLMLARGRVMFVGQPVALVLADSETAAADGLEKVRVDYEELPAATTIESAIAEDAPLVWASGVPGESEDSAAHGASADSENMDDDKPSNIVSRTPMTSGDLEAGFAQADVIIERTFTTPMVHQNSLETHGVIAQPDIVTGGVNVWSSTQSPFGVRQQAAELLDMPESDVVVNGTHPGGAFGAKFPLYEMLVVAAACAVSRPVKLILTRGEELAATNPSPALRFEAKIGAKQDGTLTALECDVYMDSGCYPFGLATFVGIMFGSFYPIENYKVTTIEVLTHKQGTGAYRAPGAPSVIFALDTLMDEIASQLKLDPIEVRLKNAARPGDKMLGDRTWAPMGMVETLEALQAHPIWQNRQNARDAGRGVGIAIGGWLGGTEPAAAVCGLNRDGLLNIHVGSADITGTTTGFAILAAEVFGIDPSEVRVSLEGTRTAPYSGGSGGSKVTYATGGAVVRAAEEAKRQVLTIAAEEFEAAIEDLEIVDGEVRVKGMPSKSIALKDIAKQTMRFGGKYEPVHGNGRTAITDQAPAFCAQLAEVEVDEETGEVIVHRLVVVQDVGRAINPLLIEGQLMGGATQGIGWALHEDLQYDTYGQLISGSWMDYSIPDALQAPPMELVLVEVPSEHGPFGARGVGEPPIIPTAAAIANAIYDVTGARLTDLPMTAPRVLSALAKRNGKTG